MTGKVQCSSHGEGERTFVCTHLAGDAVALGFHRGEPTESNPFPDAWCNDCELIRAAHNGWNEQTEGLLKASVLCSRCYERARIRNTRTAVTLDDLAEVRWKCATCEEWHTGPCLDFGYSAPFYWNAEHEAANRRSELPASWGQRAKTFLDEDFCAIDDYDFFVRGLLRLPILGTAKYFSWGVWGSLSRQNFELLLEKNDDPERGKLPPMFSWLSNRIPEYPETLSLKLYAHIQPPHYRPHFEVEATDHPLSREYHMGVTPDRVKEIMLGRLRDAR